VDPNSDLNTHVPVQEPKTGPKGWKPMRRDESQNFHYGGEPDSESFDKAELKGHIGGTPKPEKK
jgi:hypothetical protein